jgi:toxin ParE1/3/4
MKRWHISNKAKHDLSDIRRFTLEQWGSPKAEKYLNNLYEKIQLVAERPSIGIDCSKSLNLGRNIRSVLYVSHIIYYDVSETYISVVAVLHQSMVPKKHLLSRLEE